MIYKIKQFITMKKFTLKLTISFLEFTIIAYIHSLKPINYILKEYFIVFVVFVNIY